MSRFIDRSMVELQVETNRENVWVTDGLAVRQRNYEPVGLPFDCTDRGGLAFPEETAPRVLADRTSRTFTSTRTGWVISVNSNGEAQKAVDLGPVMAQSRTGVPVRPGMLVNWSGQFRLRKTGLHNVGSSGTIGGLDVRVSIWGVGVTTDEYGVETTNKIEIITWQPAFQPYTPFVAPNGYVDFTLPTVSNGVVPAGVDRIYLSVTLIHQTDNLPHTGQYQSFYWVPLDTDFFSIPTATPLRLRVIKPDLVNLSSPASASSTGYAFVNRKYFANLPADSEAALVSVSAAAVDVQIWEWTGAARGALLATVTVPAGGRVVTPVATTTGQIELASAGSYGVERVTAREFRTATVEQNHLMRYQYVDVLDDVNLIRAEGIEADLSMLTVQFASNTVDPMLRAGRRVRLVATHSAGRTQVFAGVIRGRRKVFRLGRPDLVEITVHSAWGALGQIDCPVAYDDLAEYAPLVHTAGIPVVIDGVDYTGPARPLPDGWDYFPSYDAEEGQSMVDSILMARNTRKGFAYVDRLDRVVVASTLPNSVAADLTDIPGEGDMSYSTGNFESAGDAETIVNAVEIREHLLDRKDYVERVMDKEPPPKLFGDIKSRTQTVEYRRDSSIQLYGLNRRSFDVVRGSGEWADIIADNYGATFAGWAAPVLDEYGTDDPAVNALRLVVTSDAELQLISRLQVLDAVVIRRAGVSVVRRIRRLEHAITPHGSSHKWTLDLRFDTAPAQTHWLPIPAAPLIVLGDTDAGTIFAPSKGLVDGRHPSEPDVYQLDGGTL